MRHKECLEYLVKNNLTITIAESLTGGMVASKVVSFPGISACFSRGYVTYSDAAKHRVLGVRKKTLAKYTAVSKNTAMEMASCAKRLGNTDIGLATTGYAGPDGGDKKCPVGTVFIACKVKDKMTCKKYRFFGPRNIVRIQAADKALKLLYKCIRKYA